MIHQEPTIPAGAELTFRITVNLTLILAVQEESVFTVFGT
jgi:hypothetical protein